MIIGNSFRLKSILLGIATGLILTNFFGFVVGFVVIYGFGRTALISFANSMAFLVFGIILGVIVNGLSGWATAMSARVNKLGNTLAMSIILLVLSAWLYSFLSVQQPTWYVYLGRLLTIPAALIGAYLQSVLSNEPSRRQ